MDSKAEQLYPEQHPTTPAITPELPKGANRIQDPHFSLRAIARLGATALVAFGALLGIQSNKGNPEYSQQLPQSSSQGTPDTAPSIEGPNYPGRFTVTRIVRPDSSEIIRLHRDNATGESYFTDKDGNKIDYTHEQYQQELKQWSESVDTTPKDETKEQTDTNSSQIPETNNLQPNTSSVSTETLSGK